MFKKTIVIIGGGPSGSTLGILLAKKGHKVILFDSEERPEMIVGESLVPAIVVMLRELEVEEEVKKLSIYKPGATIWLGSEEEVSFGFSLAKGKIPPYAYNTPRHLFDEVLIRKVESAGVTIIRKIATVERIEGTDSVTLSEASLRATNGLLDSQPDLIIDTTGRTRLLPRLLNIPSIEGKRKDIALFAHLKNVKLTSEGNIHVDRYSKGWGWRIPLPGRVSVGIVVNPLHLAEFGSNKEAGYDNFLKREPGLKCFTENAERISPVTKYTNYQKISKRMVGANWALAGDSAGFLDPIFSTGLFLSMKSAFELAKAIETGTKKAMQNYEKGRLYELEVWQEIIENWYDGRLFTLFRVGRDMRNSLLGKIIDPHMTKHVTRIFTGEAGDGSYSRRLLRFMTKYGLRGEDPLQLAIK